MKKILLVTIVVLCASPVWALRLMGPPTPQNKAGQIGLGLDWSHSQFDLRSDEAVWNRRMENDLYFARVLLGVTDWVEISGGIGISDLDLDENQGVRSGNDFAWGVGSKLKFWELKPFDLGAAFQLTSLRGDGETLVGGSLLDTKLDAYIIECAVGPSYEANGLCIYGGPFVHFINGDMQIKSAGVNNEFDIDEEPSEIGGYVGVSAEIVKNTNVGLEYHLTDDSWAIGVSLVHKFGTARKAQVNPMPRSYNPWPTLPKKTPPQPKGPNVKLETDASGEPMKDKSGNFIFTPVEEKP